MAYEEEEVCTILWCVCDKMQKHGDLYITEFSSTSELVDAF